ncbi:syntaxin [Trichophyton mentagrophytes]|nr:syntaxin [Trichophyton mentagrophytes]
MNSEMDPFLQVQADILSTLSTTRPLFSSYQRIRSLATSPSNPELIQAREELEATVADLSADLKDLVESVRAIEYDPYRYGLELDEVERRRKLVDDVGKEIEEMRQELQRTVHEHPGTAGKRASSGPSSASAAGGSGLPAPSTFDNLLDEEGQERGEDYYSEMEQQRQVELMQDQDQQLDGVFRTVVNLRQQADDMGRELEEQSVMLKDVDTLAERVGGKLQDGVKRVGHIIKKNEGEYYLPFAVFHLWYANANMGQIRCRAAALRF